jgi:alanyl-tRNA synthetase
MSADLRARRLYYDDSYTASFEAEVVSTSERDGRHAVELDRTFFYPESGGQPSDRGTLGGVPVVDVQAKEEGRVLHVLDREPEGSSRGHVGGVIDWSRRFDLMQQHTGQHVLSAAFEHVVDAATISSRLGETRSTIDVALDHADWRLVQEVETAANRVLWEDRPVERHWVDAAGMARFALRKPPKVIENIRIVEIPDWDASACGGTHTLRTGEVGVVKVLGWEKVRGNVRFDFVCGARALADHAWRTESLAEAARRCTLKDRDLLDHLERAAAERDQLRRRVAELQTELMLREARERVGDPPRGVAEFSLSRERADVRTFAIQCLASGAPWVVVAAAAPDPVVLIARARGPGVDLKSLLPGLLERSRGKGGGNPEMIQVSAQDASSAEGAYRWVVDEVRALTG